MPGRKCRHARRRLRRFLLLLLLDLECVCIQRPKNSDQLKRIRTWIENGVRGSWRPVKLGEGSLRIEQDGFVEPPTMADVHWDGQHERVERSPPRPSGASIDLASVMVLVHTRQGCYNNRGRLARCAHIQQRAFHEGMFRRGSSYRWETVLTVQ